MTRMTRAQLIWIGLVALFYAAFWNWYGGNGEPIDPKQGEAMIAEIEGLYGFDAGALPPGHFLRNMREMIARDDGREFYAVNLEKLKHTPAARAADRRYVNLVFPLLFERGGHPVFAGSVAGLMMGRYGDSIDRVAVVRYRSLYDLLDMVRDPRFVAGEPDKMAALEHTEVFIVRPALSLLQMRLFAGMAAILLALAGVAIIARVQSARVKR